MKAYRQIEHTADIGLEVRGSTLADLFINAAMGMFELVFGSAKFPQQKIKKIKLALSSNVKEELLVKWLEELLFLFDVKQLAPIDCNITKISDTKLSAEVGCIPIDVKKHKPKLQIKAVTYHALEVSKSGKGYETRIIFDI